MPKKIKPSKKTAKKTNIKGPAKAANKKAAKVETKSTRSAVASKPLKLQNKVKKGQESTFAKIAKAILGKKEAIAASSVRRGSKSSEAPAEKAAKVDLVAQYKAKHEKANQLNKKNANKAPTEVLSETPEPEEIFLTDAEGRRYCRARDCDQLSRVEGYCRYHYLLFWKRIQVRKKILSDGKLERYVEELTARYPDKYLEILRKDLRTEKDFLAAISELELEESASSEEAEFEEDSNYIEEMRGVSSETVIQDDEDY